MTDHQPPRPDQVRIHILLEKPDSITPGELVRATGVDPEFVGQALVMGHEALVDVAEHCGVAARAALDKVGSTQVSKPVKPPATWNWMRLAVGRNHGLTIGHLRKLLEKAGAEPVGQIHINNTHTLVGLREDRIAAAKAFFADKRINGIAARPGAPEPGEVHGPAAFIPKR